MDAFSNSIYTMITRALDSDRWSKFTSATADLGVSVSGNASDDDQD
jgi:hypothetical protein